MALRAGWGLMATIAGLVALIALALRELWG